jgi:hypothetical protein
MKQERRKARLSDESLSDRSRRHGLAGRPTKFAAKLMNYAGRFRGFEHGSTLGGIPREGLLANHVLSRSDGLEHDRCMGVRGRRNGYGVNAGQGECFL